MGAGGDSGIGRAIAVHYARESAAGIAILYKVGIDWQLHPGTSLALAQVFKPWVVVHNASFPSQGTDQTMQPYPHFPAESACMAHGRRSPQTHQPETLLYHSMVEAY